MSLDDAQLGSRLAATTRFGRLVHVAACGSTQDLAAADPDPSPAVYWADHQTAGRGRHQRVWDDEPGTDLAVTFRFRAALPQPLALPASTPLCVLQAIESASGCRLRIKWPNDVYCDSRKLAGVLIDADGRNGYAIGIGVNVNRTRFPRELEPVATSLALTAGRAADRGALLLALAQRLDLALRQLEAGEVDGLAGQFAQRLDLLGRPVVVGLAADATLRGRLVAVDFARLTLDAGRSVPLAAVQSLRADAP